MVDEWPPRVWHGVVNPETGEPIPPGLKERVKMGLDDKSND